MRLLKMSKKKSANKNRVSVRDIDSAIFRPSNNVKDPNIDNNFMEELDRDTVCFTIFGKHDYLDGNGMPIIDDEDNLNVLAKIVVINNGYPKYMIKRDSNGRLFNPLGIDEGGHNKFIHHAGKEQYEFRSVNKNAFSYYIQFLKTKNMAHLRTAEREVF